VYYYHLDVSDFSAIQSTAETIRREHGNPTVLINNAGICEYLPQPNSNCKLNQKPATGALIIDSDATKTERLFKVNIISHFMLIKEFLPGMLQAKKGHIVTIASMASFLSASGIVDYSCSKVGALYLHEGMSRFPLPPP
jgi:NAD(P)-dependent dehydrogenase (short-subunit alcohol dehydrogenase family)